MAYTEGDRQAKRRYYLKHKERLKQYQKDFRKRDDFSEKHAVHTKNYRDRLKNQVFEHYGKKCACCGETEIKFLTIDHVNGGGNKHRKEIQSGRTNGGTQTYAWLINNNFPSDFQTLCMNCNWGRAHNNGVCPHRR